MGTKENAIFVIELHKELNVKFEKIYYIIVWKSGNLKYFDI